MTNALKVHLRLFDIHGITLRVVTLRPQTGVRFSTNYFHDTWHILGGPDASALLGRLLWGLAFQRLPGTLVLIDREHLVPTPFEADRPDPILLVPDGLTHIDVDLLRALKLRLRRCPGPPTTIRWHTFSIAEPERRYDLNHSRERMSRLAGFICYTAPPDILRSNGYGISRMGSRGYFSLAERDRSKHWRVDGEFQLIGDFRRKVSAAMVARAEILDGADRAIADRPELERIYDRQDRVLQRRVH